MSDKSESIPVTLHDLPELPRREEDTHKGSYGRVYVLAGSVGMTGAAALTCDAVLRSGAGLCTLGIGETLYSIMAVKLTCTMVQPLPENEEHGLSIKGLEELRRQLQRADVFALGPGLGQQRETQTLVVQLLERIAQVPLVIDADGLNILAKNRDTLRNCRDRAVLTPHPAEMARLLGTQTAAVLAARAETARGFARAQRVVVVLKGARTVVTDGERLYVNASGNPGMATAGSGDVLTGVIAGLRAQGFAAFEAAALGVLLHGLAGDVGARELGQEPLVATDLIDRLPAAFRLYRTLCARRHETTRLVAPPAPAGVARRDPPGAR